MSTPTMDDAAKVLADPTAYADDARLHAALTHLRANNPVAWVDNPPYRPFWRSPARRHQPSSGTTTCSEPRPLLATAQPEQEAQLETELGRYCPHGRPTPPQGAVDRRVGSAPRRFAI
jgi:hypothetical protein